MRETEDQISHCTIIMEIKYVCNKKSLYTPSMCLRRVGRSDQNDNNAFTVRAVIWLGARIWRNIINK